MTRRYKSWEDIYSKGPCTNCRRTRECRKGLCYPCRKPKAIRDLIEAGMPFGTVGGLLAVVRKCKSDKEAQRVLETVHPVVMENVVVKGGTLKRRHKKYTWVRSNGWVE